MSSITAGETLRSVAPWKGERVLILTGSRGGVFGEAQREIDILAAAHDAELGLAAERLDAEAEADAARIVDFDAVDSTAQERRAATANRRTCPVERD
jgi:hypothetical protein